MEIIIVILLIIMSGLIFFLVIRDKKGDLDQKIQSALNERFVSFQEAIHNSMEKTRLELESSKNIISDHAIKTLDTIKDMGTTIEQIVQQQREAQELGNSLRYLLQTPKLRGSYGEEILEEMLERVLPKGIWQRQYAIEGSERVDAVVIYKDIVVPIDAKFPREIYERYLSAENPDDKKRNWKLYEDGLKIQINSIKTKYIKPHKGTSDFAIMFIPSESIYYETIAEHNFLGQPCAIYEYARNNHVVPVSPNTFYAFLQVVIMGIRNLDMIQNAKQLQDALKKIERNFGFFYKKYEDIGNALDKAQEAFKLGNTHISRFKDNVESTVRLDLPEEGKNLIETPTKTS